MVKLSRYCLAVLFTVLISAGCSRASAGGFDQHNLENPRIKLGVETLLTEPEYLDLVKGKRVGLITNPTGVDSKLRSTIDLLHEHPDIQLAKLFAPEHGVRGDEYAGAKIENQIDEDTGVPIVSLYGRTASPEEYLKGVDVMMYDIQDVGSRSYTYIYAMADAMSAAGAAGVPFIVLDRPNPCGGNKVSGNILKPEEGTSGVGRFAIAYMYGLTPGETAMMFNKEYIENECNLTVVPMRGYTRDMLQWDTGTAFVPASPNVPHAETAFYYNLVGIIGELRADATIGVGYPLAFEIIAAPYINRDEFAAALRAKNIPGLMVRPITIKPYANPFEGEVVHGAHFFISDYHAIQPVEAQIHMMEVLQRLYPEQGLFSDENRRSGMFDKVMGTSEIRKRIDAGDKAEAIIASYQDDVAEWMKLRAKYLIY